MLEATPAEWAESFLTLEVEASGCLNDPLHRVMMWNLLGRSSEWSTKEAEEARAGTTAQHGRVKG